MSKIPVGCPTPAPNTLQYLSDVVLNNHYSMGKWVKQFETAFAAKFGYEHALTCANGTVALHLALLALGIGEGDEVIVPATTFVATANAVKYVGATPIICDVDKDTWNLDVEKMQKLDNDRVKAVMWVHLYGNPSDVSTMANYCRKRGIYLIEDCAESIGAYGLDRLDLFVGGSEVKLVPKVVGMIGDIAAFSFYGNKTITTGEGGMVVTHDRDIAAKVAFYRGQGQDPNLRFWHTDVGYNYRLTDLQGALGCAQLEIVGDLLEKRRVLDTLYRRLLDGKVTFQVVREGCTPGYWAFGCLLPSGVNVTKVQAMLELDGIETRRFFYPLNSMPMYKDSAPKGTPVANEIFNRGIWLPLHAELSLNDVKFICDSLLGALERNGHEQEAYPEYS